MGAATAYYLAHQGVRATVLERGGIACAASGSATLLLAATRPCPVLRR